MALKDHRLAGNRSGTVARRAVLVRHAEQVHRRPLNRQAKREESGGEVERLSITSTNTGREAFDG